jgi:hypothetical protein
VNRSVLAFALAFACVVNAAEATFTVKILTPETALIAAHAALKS